MAFRQLWAAALVYAGAITGAALLVLGLDRLVFHFSETTQLCLLVAFAVVAFVAPGVWGNAILHTHVRKTMASAVAATSAVPEACVLLNRQASSRQRMVWLALLNAVVAGAAIGTWIAWPDASRPASSASPALAPTQVVPPAPVSPKPALAPPPVPIHSSASAPSVPTSAAPPSKPELPAPLATMASSATASVAMTPSPSPSASAPALAAPKVAASKPKAPASLTTTATSKATATERRFYINVGLFAEDGNARRAHAKLIDAGLAAFTQELDSPKGKRTRVRVGPFDTRSEADAAAEKIRALKLDAVVFRQ